MYLSVYLSVYKHLFIHLTGCLQSPRSIPAKLKISWPPLSLYFRGKTWLKCHCFPNFFPWLSYWTEGPRIDPSLGGRGRMWAQIIMIHGRSSQGNVNRRILFHTHWVDKNLKVWHYGIGKDAEPQRVWYTTWERINRYNLERSLAVFSRTKDAHALWPGHSVCP